MPQETPTQQGRKSRVKETANLYEHKKSSPAPELTIDSITASPIVEMQVDKPVQPVSPTVEMLLDEPGNKGSSSKSVRNVGVDGVDFEDDLEMVRAEFKKTRTFAQHGDAFLIADPDKDDQSVVHFRTRQEYEDLYGYKRASELDEKCILIKDGDGNYLPKPQYYYRIDVSDVEGKEQKSEARKQRFAQKMKDLGLTTKAHAKQEYFGKIKKEDATYKTPGGMRERAHKYASPERAGELNPDVMVRTQDGRLIGLYPSKNADLKDKSPSEIRKVFKGDFHIKSTDNVYHAADRYAKKYGDRSVEKRLAYFNGKELTYNATLPKVLVRVGEKYFDLALLRDKMPDSRQTRQALRGSSKADLLVLTKAGAGYVTPSFLKYSDKAHFEATMEAHGISKNISYAKPQEAAPGVLVQVGAQSFKSSKEITQEARNGKTLKELYTNTRIFVQTQNKYGEASRAFKILAEYERGDHTIPREVAQDVGIEAREGKAPLIRSSPSSSNSKRTEAGYTSGNGSGSRTFDARERSAEYSA